MDRSQQQTPQLETLTRQRVWQLQLAVTMGAVPTVSHVAAVASDVDLCAALAYARGDQRAGTELAAAALDLGVAAIDLASVSAVSVIL